MPRVPCNFFSSFPSFLFCFCFCFFSLFFLTAQVDTLDQLALGQLISRNFFDALGAKVDARKGEKKRGKKTKKKKEGRKKEERQLAKG
jgi:hypothetical protein